MSDVRVSQPEQALTALSIIKQPKTAMCRLCENEPLVWTRHWRHKEFICLGCGHLYEWLEPKPAESTPEILALSEARDKEWEENAKGLLTPHSWHTDCEKCDRGSGEYHAQHATEEERAAHEKAVAWVLERTGRSAAPIT